MNRSHWLVILSLLLLQSSPAQEIPGLLRFQTRSRQPARDATNQFEVVQKSVEWDPRKTALIICDMWDQHWCKGATARVAEMAPRMNEVVKAARQRGVFIVHAPSDTMKFYADWAQRKRAQQAPKAVPPTDVTRWHALNTAKEPPLPIDDSDGGCDDWPPCPGGSPWKRQIPTLEIASEDAISDSGEEVYNLLQQEKRDNILIMGVHENMCVLGRPFSIRQLVTVGKNVLLIRDMTDTMYNSRRAPYVPHFVGTDLVAEHIEKYWCATITSDQITGGQPFRFKGDQRRRVAIITGENEYRTAETLAEFAKTELAGHGLMVDFVNASPAGGNEFTNWQAITRADLLVLSVRRRTPTAPMLDAIRTHLESGKPLVAIRTASHAFAARAPDGEHASWEAFDREVLGATYEGHYANDLRPHIQRAPNAVHPILNGFPAAGFSSGHSLYMSHRLAVGTLVLTEGIISLEGREVIEPVGWINTNANRRVFYTSMGGPDDFKQPSFRRLLFNGTLWALNDTIPTQEISARGSVATAHSGWQPLRVPGTWEDNSGGALRDLDGFAWYRSIVRLPDSWQGKNLELWVERVDNVHEAYINGVRVGGAGAFPPAYQNEDLAAGRYPIKAQQVRAGADNLVAIRVYDAGGRGGFKGDAPVLLTKDEAIKLDGLWQFRAGDDVTWSKEGAPSEPAVPVFSQVIDAAGVSARTYQQQLQEAPLSPAASLAQFRIAPDLEIEQVLAEPIVRQPVSLSFDERGRLWVIQYLQYPDPAGLKMTSHDNVWRAVYDKVPPPPPHHFPGADKITIHEDTNGDGVFDKHKTFVEGLNIVTAVAHGRGGVWVLNPPYLLFYADKDHDDVPDGDPEVRLSGFGLEDTHSVANSLRWGPDGWLYGCQGSTVTGNIIVYQADGKPSGAKPVYSQGQNIWRYHPESRRYEVFAEGGGNAFGLELDAAGRIFSGHNGGNTRGFHYVQGGYLQKGFEKHGPLSNPYAFGYFPPMPHNQAERFTHNFVIYDGGALPGAYEGKLFGVEPLQGRLVLSEIRPDASSFRTRDLSYPVTTGDQWFRPVDIKVGPDGAIYVADWYERQVNHYRNHEGQIDKNNGRVYRLKVKGAQPITPFNLATRSDDELLALLTNQNKWFRQEALRLLGDRKSASIGPKLVELVRRNASQLALEALWALNLSVGLDDHLALECLDHSNPQVRCWTVRLMGDRTTQDVSPVLAAKLTQMAKTDTDLEVRCQLACTAKRLSAVIALPIVKQLLSRDEDAGDPRQPLLIWWALESKADSDRDAVLALCKDPAWWGHPMVRGQILERLMRRYAAAATRKDLLTCAQLLRLAPGQDDAARLMAGLELAFKGRSAATLPEELVEAMAKAGGESVALGVRRGQPDAVQAALRIISDPSAEERQRLNYIRLFGEVKQQQSVPVLLQLLHDREHVVVLKTAVAALQQYEDPAIGQVVAERLISWPKEAQAAGIAMLASRPDWAASLLSAVAHGHISKDSVPREAVRRLQLLQEPRLAESVRTLWGRERVPTSAEMQERIRQLTGVVSNGSGSPYEGQKVFSLACATCHKLFGEGGQVGPDLTTFKRDDIGNMLLNIVNPSAEIREGYENYLVTTKDGRTLSGFLADKDTQVLVLRGVDGENTVLAQDVIGEMKVSGASLMPEGLLDALSEQQVRDLFAYLRSTQPLVR